MYFLLCPKQGLKIEGGVLHRVYILGLFCPKQGQGLKPSAAPLYPTIGQVPPPRGNLNQKRLRAAVLEKSLPLPTPSEIFLSLFLERNNEKAEPNLVNCNRKKRIILDKCALSHLWRTALVQCTFSKSSDRKWLLIPNVTRVVTLRKNPGVFLCANCYFIVFYCIFFSHHLFFVNCQSYCFSNLNLVGLTFNGYFWRCM